MCRKMSPVPQNAVISSRRLLMALFRPVLTWQSGLASRRAHGWHPRSKSGVVLSSLLVLGACESDKCQSDCEREDAPARRSDAAPLSSVEPGEHSPSSDTEDEAGTTDSTPFFCRDDVDCAATPLAACSLQLGQCVRCTIDQHCSTEKPHCAVRASDELNRCVECQTSSECPSGLCRDDVCLACNPENNQGCPEGVCAEMNGLPPQCVQCATDEDCPTGLCLDHACKTCDVRTNAGCNDGTVCLPRSEVEPQVELDSSVTSTDAGQLIKAQVSATADGMCVECAASRPCADPNRPVCLNNACVTCDPAATTDNGCSPATPFCLQGDPPLDAGAGDEPNANRCVECLDASDCQAAACVDNVCQPCDPDTHEGCGDGGVCLPRADEQTAGPIAYVCAECGADKLCDANKQCGADGRCHECLESSDCKLADKPFCQPDGECGACTKDEQCPAKAPHCSVTTGECVACTKDEHCSEASSGSVCYSARHICVECTETNFDACNGNPCHVLPGRNQYTCFGEDDLPAELDGGVSTECKRCTQNEDCDAITECVALSDVDLRCLPPATTAADRTDCTMLEATDLEGQTGDYCVPFGC